MRRAASLLIAAVFAFTQILFAHQAEASMWDDRREATGRGKTRQLAMQSPAAIRLPALSAIPRQPVAALRATGRALPSSVDQLLPRIDARYGTVRDIALPAADTAFRGTVLFLQDIHQNQEAQANISSLISPLLRDKAVNALALEGEFAPADFLPLRRFADRAILDNAADHLLRAGKISGAVRAFLDLDPASSISFSGIDDQPLYDANVKAYLDSRVAKAGVSSRLHRERAAIALEARTTFSAALATADATLDRYHAGGASLLDVALLIKRNGGVVSPELGKFMSASALERAMSWRQVEHDRRAMLEKALPAISPADLSRLMAASVALRDGALTHAGFYTLFADICRRARCPLTTYPAMDAYVRYVALSESIDTARLLNDVQKAEDALYGRLAGTPAEKELVARARSLRWTEKLTEFELTRTDWDHRPSVFQTTEDLRPFVAFYEAAMARDAAMARRVAALATATAKNKSLPTLAVVAGGFHADGLTSSLTKAGLAVVTVTPKLTKVDGLEGSAYLSVFAQERTPLEKLHRGEKLFVTPSPSAGTQLLPAMGTALSYPSGARGDAPRDRYNDLSGRPVAENVAVMSRAGIRRITIGAAGQAIQGMMRLRGDGQVDQFDQTVRSRLSTEFDYELAMDSLVADPTAVRVLQIAAFVAIGMVAGWFTALGLFLITAWGMKMAGKKNKPVSMDTLVERLADDPSDANADRVLAAVNASQDPDDQENGRMEISQYVETRIRDEEVVPTRLLDVYVRFSLEEGSAASVAALRQTWQAEASEVSLLEDVDAGLRILGVLLADRAVPDGSQDQLDYLQENSALVFLADAAQETAAWVGENLDVLSLDGGSALAVSIAELSEDHFSPLSVAHRLSLAKVVARWGDYVSDEVLAGSTFERLLLDNGPSLTSEEQERAVALSHRAQWGWSTAQQLERFPQAFTNGPPYVDGAQPAEADEDDDNLDDVSGDDYSPYVVDMVTASQRLAAGNGTSGHNFRMALGSIGREVTMPGVNTRALSSLTQEQIGHVLQRGLHIPELETEEVTGLFHVLSLLDDETGRRNYISDFLTDEDQHHDYVPDFMILPSLASAGQARAARLARELSENYIVRGMVPNEAIRSRLAPANIAARARAAADRREEGWEDVVITQLNLLAAIEETGIFERLADELGRSSLREIVPLIDQSRLAQYPARRARFLAELATAADRNLSLENRFLIPQHRLEPGQRTFSAEQRKEIDDRYIDGQMDDVVFLEFINGLRAILDAAGSLPVVEKLIRIAALDVPVESPGYVLAIEADRLVTAAVRQVPGFQRAHGARALQTAQQAITQFLDEDESPEVREAASLEARGALQALAYLENSSHYQPFRSYTPRNVDPGAVDMTVYGGVVDNLGNHLVNRLRGNRRLTRNLPLADQRALELWKRSVEVVRSANISLRTAQGAPQRDVLLADARQTLKTLRGAQRRTAVLVEAGNTLNQAIYSPETPTPHSLVYIILTRTLGLSDSRWVRVAGLIGAIGEMVGLTLVSIYSPDVAAPLAWAAGMIVAHVFFSKIALKPVPGSLFSVTLLHGKLFALYPLAAFLTSAWGLWPVLLGVPVVIHLLTDLHRLFQFSLARFLSRQESVLPPISEDILLPAESQNRKVGGQSGRPETILVISGRVLMSAGGEVMSLSAGARIELEKGEVVEFSPSGGPAELTHVYSFVAPVRDPAGLPRWRRWANTAWAMVRRIGRFYIALGQETVSEDVARSEGARLQAMLDHINRIPPMRTALGGPLSIPGNLLPGVWEAPGRGDPAEAWWDEVDAWWQPLTLQAQTSMMRDDVGIDRVTERAQEEIIGPRAEGKTALDVGIGVGNTTAALISRGAAVVHAIDTDPAMLDRARRNLANFSDEAERADVRMRTDDATRLRTVQNDSMDVVTIFFAAFNVLPGLRPRMLRRIFEVLKPGGELIMVDYAPAPGAPNQWTWSAEKWAAVLEAAGFEVTISPPKASHGNSPVLYARKPSGPSNGSGPSDSVGGAPTDDLVGRTLALHRTPRSAWLEGVLANASARPLNLGVTDALNSPAYWISLGQAASYQAAPKTESLSSAIDSGTADRSRVGLLHLHDLTDLADLDALIAKTRDGKLKGVSVVVHDPALAEAANQRLSALRNDQTAVVGIGELPFDQERGVYRYDDVLAMAASRGLTSIRDANILVVSRRAEPFEASEALSRLIQLLINLGDGWARVDLSTVLGAARLAQQQA